MGGECFGEVGPHDACDVLVVGVVGAVETVADDDDDQGWCLSYLRWLVDSEPGKVIQNVGP